MDGNVAEYWLLAANVSLVSVSYNYDHARAKQKRLSKRTAPSLSQGICRCKGRESARAGDVCSPAETARLADELLVVDPRNRGSTRSKLMVARESGDDAEADKFRARLRELPGGDPFIMLFDTLAFCPPG